MEYVIGVSEGLKAAARRTKPIIEFELRGPAGLFKSIDKHHLCWGLLEYCNSNISQCPMNVITFHRKGVSTSSDIVVNTEDLIYEIHKTYPNLKQHPYANTECDPSSGWSKNLSSNADVSYANSLTSIVFDHWNALYKNRLPHLESISHDNSFLSYHPYEFEQRTLLARFVMNNTNPKTINFIQKPVYGALGLLGSLAEYATEITTEKNVSYIITLSRNYAAVLLLSKENYQMDEIEFTFKLSRYWMNATCAKFAYFAEYLNQNRTDPYAIWMQYNRPSYPNDTVIADMQHAQVSLFVNSFKYSKESNIRSNFFCIGNKGPHELRNPKIVNRSVKFKLNIHLQHPWLILVRICATTVANPTKIKNLRIRTMDKTKILLLWNEYEYPTFERCVRTYEVFYAPFNNKTSNQLKWSLITENKHIPFLSYCHQIKNNSQISLEGKINIIFICYQFDKIQLINSINIFF